jgi:hypothetical protein
LLVLVVVLPGEAEMVTRTAGRRWLAAAAAVAAVVVAGLQVVTAQPAAALPPLTLKTGTSGPVSTGAVKSAEAFCAANQVVVGGGGEVVGNPPHTTVLTALEPHAVEGATPPRFVVRARALAFPQFQEVWQVKAYALCAPAASMQPYLIVKSTSTTSQLRFRAGTATCPGGRVAYSAGVTTSNTSAFGVQLVRTSGPLDIARATVRAFGTAVPAPWQLSTFAVCGPRKDGIVAVARVAAGPIVGVSCPAGTQQIHGAGGGLGLTDGGTNWIRELRPANVQSPGSMTVRMSLMNPGYEVVAHTTCATRT